MQDARCEMLDARRRVRGRHAQPVDCGKDASSPPPFATTTKTAVVLNAMVTPAALVVRWIRSEAKTKPLPTLGRANRYPYCRIVAATETQPRVNSSAALFRSRYPSA